MPHKISYYPYSSIATMSLFCTISQTLSLISQNIKTSRELEYIHFAGNLSRTPYYSCVNQHTTYEVCSFTNTYIHTYIVTYFPCVRACVRACVRTYIPRYYIHNVVQMQLISYIHNVGGWQHLTHQNC